MKATDRMIKRNEKREEPPNLEENQSVYIKPNIRTKTQPRGTKQEAKNIKDRTFENENNIKRNKNKIKRLKKKHF
jgi:hypothetical protein